MRALVLFMLLFSAPVHAQHVGGGGDKVFFEGEWLLKDLLINKYHEGKPYILSPLFQSWVRSHLMPLVEIYSGVIQSPYWNELLGDGVDIRIVKKLPCSPEGLRHADYPTHQYGCTVNGITYLLEKEFNTLKPGQGILAILHQRAHAFDPSLRAHEWIEPFIQAVWVAETIKAEQSAGRYHTLSGRDVGVLEHFYSHAIRAGLGRKGAYIDTSGTRSITRQGGGVLISDFLDIQRSAVISADSYVGIGSALHYRGEKCNYRYEPLPLIRNNSIVEDSELYCTILTHSKAVRTRNYQVQQVTASRDGMKSHPQDFTVFENSTLTDSSVGSYSAVHVTDSHLTRSEIFSTYQHPVWVDHSTLEDSTISTVKASDNWQTWESLSGSGLETTSGVLEIKAKTLKNRRIQSPFSQE